MECQICLESCIPTQLMCCCILCPPCILNTVNVTYLEVFDQIKCPGQCKQSHSVHNLMQNEALHPLNDILLHKYLKNQTDIRGCPKSDCTYYGMLTEQCWNYQCICDYAWKEQQNAFNLQNSIINFYTTRDCPQCARTIIKNGGCNHMTCKCKHEFCWICLQHYQNHNNRQCKINIITKYTILWILLFNIIMTLNLHDIFYQILMYVVTLGLLNGCAMFLILSLLELYQLIKIKSQLSLYYAYGNETFERIIKQRSLMFILFLSQSTILGMIFYLFNQDDFLGSVEQILSYQTVFIVIVCTTLRIKKIRK